MSLNTHWIYSSGIGYFNGGGVLGYVVWNITGGVFDRIFHL